MPRKPIQTGILLLLHHLTHMKQMWWLTKLGLIKAKRVAQGENLSLKQQDQVEIRVNLSKVCVADCIQTCLNNLKTLQSKSDVMLHGTSSPFTIFVKQIPQ